MNLTRKVIHFVWKPLYFGGQQQNDHHDLEKVCIDFT